jgi:hypothetical protein
MDGRGGGGADIPVLPEEDRHILADMGLYYLFLDKNDSRANVALRDANIALQNLINIREPSKFRMSPRGGVRP